MISLKKYLRPFAMAIFTVCVTILSYRPTQDEREQIAFITGFYQQYPVNRLITQIRTPPDGAFYSQGLAKLLAASQQRCGDMVSDAQEIIPDPTFEKLHFKTARAGKNAIDVSFNVEGHDRHIKYIFVREAGGWRVDDLYSGGKSLRTLLTKESAGTGDGRQGRCARCAELYLPP